MNDTDLDRVLSDVARQWRSEHVEAAPVEWGFTAPRRDRRQAWFVSAAVAAAVALVVAVPALMSDRTHRPNVTPGHSVTPTPTPSSTTQAQKGAPRWFYALDHGKLVQLDPHTVRQVGAVNLTGHRAGLVGAAPDGDDAYFATTMPGCRVRIVRFHVTGSPQGTYDVATVAGTVDSAGGQYVGIAVSPDGRQLALPVQTCASADSEDLVVIDTTTGQVRRWHGQRNDVSYVGSMQWSPDGHRLAFTWTPCCGGGTDGTHLLEVDQHGSTSYLDTPQLLTQYSPHNDGYPYGPVFWWGQQLSVFDSGQVRAVTVACGNPCTARAQGHRTAVGRIGRVLATGLPRDVASVSSDPSGEHLLIATDNGVNPSQVFRYDRGVLTEIPGRWLQPAW
jgi:hypothetical protein